MCLMTTVSQKHTGRCQVIWSLNAQMCNLDEEIGKLKGLSRGLYISVCDCINSILTSANSHTGCELSCVSSVTRSAGWLTGITFPLSVCPSFCLSDVWLPHIKELVCSSRQHTFTGTVWFNFKLPNFLLKRLILLANAYLINIKPLTDVCLI